MSESGLPLKTASEALQNLLKNGELFYLTNSEQADASSSELSKAKTLVASRAGWANLLGQIKTTLADYHERLPLRLGMPRGELKSRLKLETRLFNEAIQRGHAEQAITATETSVRLPDHRVNFNPQQQAAIDKLLIDFRRNPYNTPLPKEVAARLGEEVIQALIEGEQLVRLSKDVMLLAETYQGFLGWLKDYLHKHQTVNVAQVRDAFDTSRKYALALLEYTDEQRVTRRVGDERVLRE